MRRAITYLALVFVVDAAANTFVVTNDTSALNPSLRTLVVNNDQTFRYRAFARQSSTAKDLTDKTLVWQMIDPADDYIHASTAPEILDATNGEFRVVTDIPAPIGTWRHQVLWYESSTTQYLGRLAWDTVAVQSPATSACPDISLGDTSVSNHFTIISTTLVEGVSVVFTALVENTYAPVVSNYYNVTVFYTNHTYIFVTNNLDNITSTIENYYTSGVSAVNGATGAVTLTVAQTANPAGVASWSGTELRVGTNLPAGTGSAWPINWTTNEHGHVGYTNAFGGFWSFDGAVLHTGQIQRRYNGGDTYSNYIANATGGSGDGFEVWSSNGLSFFRVPVEYGNYYRMLDAQTVPNPNSGWRASVRIVQIPTIVSGSASIRVGLATNRKNGDPGPAGFFTVGAYGGSDIKVQGFGWSDARTNTISGTPYPNPDVAISRFGVDALPLYLMADLTAGATTGSAYVGRSAPGSAVVSYQRIGSISLAQVPTNIGVAYIQMTANAVTHYNSCFIWDDFVIEEGLSWQ